MGASAGGLEAFTQLLKQLPTDTGMAFVLVQHLDPQHESALTQLLARATSMPVQEVTHNLAAEPNRVYVIPPKVNMTIADGVLKLTARVRASGPHRSIDSFFESLAHDKHEQAIGVILSGTATDGTLGLETIKGEGGITFAQDDSAKYDSMPRSAIAAGCVDFVLPPQTIAREIALIAKHPYVTVRTHTLPILQGTAKTSANGNGTALQAAEQNGLQKIFLLLRNRYAVDFSLYKSTTVERRINRRVVLNKQDTLKKYAAFLKGNAAELSALYADILICVTSFFRNPEGFEALKRHVFPKIVQQRQRDDPFRVWVVACSTGQEAYSIAMSFAEFSENIPHAPKLQVFATDVSDACLEKARRGLYPKTIERDISPERLRRFFVEEGGGYRISKSLREQIVFARQNLLNDPPFSRMDLISCRNLLIYLQPDLQNKIIPAFHYALKPGGFLFLGASESIGQFTELFDAEDNKQKIFVNKAVSSAVFYQPLSKERGPRAPSQRRGQLTARPTGVVEGLRSELNAQREADRVSVNRFVPPGVLINSEMHVLQFRGSTGDYLVPPTGKASFDVLKMTRQGLMLPLRAAIDEAKNENKTVLRENIRFEHDGGSRGVNVEVIPLKNLKESCFLILFEPAPGAGQSETSDRAAPPAKAVRNRNESSRVASLERELSETLDYLEAFQDQHDAANEELQAANEEVQSANEELQSINEELETSKEELESTNEELITVNEELGYSNLELSTLNADLNNLHASINTAIVLFARNLAIRRFTPQAGKLFNLVATDIGRLLSGVRHNLNVPELEDMIREVIDTVSVRECNVQDKEGRWYAVRVRPYMTLDNKIDGALLVAVDIDALKQSELESKAARDYAEAIIRTARNPLLVLRADLRVNTANEAFYKIFGTEPEETKDRSIFEISNSAWDIPKLRLLLEDILPRNSFFNDFEVVHDFPGFGRRTLLLNARRLDSETGTGMILLAIDDVTERQRASEVTIQLAAIVRASDDAIFSKTVDGTISSWNHGAERMYGYTSEEIIGKHLSALSSPDRSDECQHIEEKLRGGEQVTHFETEQVRKDGSCLHVSLSISPLYDKKGDLAGASVVARDITERRQAEERVRSSEIRYRRLFEAARDGVLLLDPVNRTITDANPFMTQLLGYPRAELLGKELCQIGLLKDEQASQDAVRQLQHGEVLRYDDLPLQTKTGERQDVECVCNLYEEDNRKVIQCNIRDISDRKQIEEERAQLLNREQIARVDAETANRAKDEFLATVSHELRSPLTAMLGWARLLRSGTLDQGTIAKALETIDRSASAQARLIEDLLEVSRIITGKLRLEFRPMELAKVIEAAIDVVRPAVAARRLRLELAIDPAVGLIAGDPDRLQQVVWNLVSNAAKFTPEGGRIAIRLERVAGSVRITVSDTGKGITPDLLPYVFDRFRQADSSTRRSYGGLGLGLAIVRHLVEMHGGTVSAESRGEGLGATFTVTLPIRAVMPQPSEPNAMQTMPKTALPSVSASALAGIRVLIVDDETDARDLLTMVLAQYSAQTKTAASAAAALETLERWQPDVLITDIAMPGENGYDLIRQVRMLETDRGGQTPAIAVTAYASGEDRARAVAAGFQMHVAKPVEPDQLAAIVADLVGRRATV